MGEAKRKRLLERKNDGKIQKIQGKVAFAQARFDEVSREFDELTYPEMQDALQDLADEVGPTLLPKDDPEIAKFQLANTVVPTNEPERHKAMTKLACQLASIIAPMILANSSVCRRAADRLDSLLTEKDPITQDPGKWELDGAARVLALVFAKRCLNEPEEIKAGRFVPFTEMDQYGIYKSADQLHAKTRIDEFLKTHRDGLTGPVLAAQKFLFALPRKAKDQILKSIHTHSDSRADYADLSAKAKRIFETEYPTIESNQRTAAFTRLYEIVREEIRDSSMEASAVAYMIAESILIKDTAAAIDYELPEAPTPPPVKAIEAVGFTDQRLTTLGVHFWEQSYKLGGTDDDAARLVKEQFEGASSCDLGIFAAKWAVHAFQRLTTTHTYAAALMCSDADKSLLEDIEVQWHGFMIIIPNGLFPYHDDARKLDTEFTRILVSSFDHSATLVLLDQSINYHDSKESMAVVSIYGKSLADLLDVSLHNINAVTDVNISSKSIEQLHRIVIMAKRLVAGLLLSLQNQNNFKSKVYPARDGKRHREAGAEPEHRVVFVGAPLKIDCRPKVMDFIQNGSSKRHGAPPQVQFIVRGHYKRQVIGIGRLGRKVIWIEPFWKGKENAPILTTPKKVGG